MTDHRSRNVQTSYFHCSIKRNFSLLFNIKVIFVFRDYNVLLSVYAIRKVENFNIP